MESHQLFERPRRLRELLRWKTITLSQSNHSITVISDHDSEATIVLTLRGEVYEGIDGEEDFTKEATTRQLIAKQLALTGPVVLTLLLEYLPTLVGVMLVSHLNSPDTELYTNAVTLSTMFTTVTSLSIGYGLCSALDTLASQAYGANHLMKIGIYLQTAFLVVYGVCLVPVYLLNWHVEAIMLLAGQDERVARVTGEYTRYTVWATPFLLLAEMLSKLLEAQNSVRPIVYIGIVSNALEITSGYCLSYHTSMGFHGAALSRALGASMQAMMLVFYIFSSGNYKAWWPGWNFEAARREVGLFVRLGVPGMAMLAMEWWAYEVLTAMAGLLPNSVTSVTVHVTLLNVMSLLYMVYEGIATSGRILVGNALGANLPHQAQRISRLPLVIAGLSSSAFAVFVFGLRFAIPTLITADRETIKHAARALLVIVPYCVIDATYCAMQGIFCGMGRQQLAAVSNAVAFYVVGLPTAALLAFRFHVGVEGLWIGLELGTFVALCLCSVALLRTDWQRMAAQAEEWIAHAC